MSDENKNVSGKGNEDTTPREPQRTVKAKENLNLRKEPSFKAVVVKVIGKDDPLTVLDEKDGWLKVAGGYVFAKNVI